MAAVKTRLHELLKRASGRPQDLVDAEALEAVRSSRAKGCLTDDRESTALR
jgi:hypothetical protein